MPISLSQKQSDAWHYLEDDTTTEILYGGGAGGGKSYLGCIWHVHRRLKYTASRGLIGRNELKTIKESTLITLLNVCTELGYKAGIHYKYNANDNVINWCNGSRTILKELKYQPSDPDFQTLGSTEFTDIFIDEAGEITEKAFEILNTRIRYKLDEYKLSPKALLTCNPGQNWVKSRYIKDGLKVVSRKQNQKFIPALVTDNPNEKFVALYQAQLANLTNDYDKLRLLYGDWDAEPKPENPFCTQYDPDKHQSTAAVFRPQTPIIFVLDFNINPFSVNLFHFWKDQNGGHAHQFDEIAIEAGSIPKLCEHIKLTYGRYLHNAFFSGDSMGKRKEIGQMDHSSLYLQIKRGLNVSSNQFKLPNNPTHENSRDDVNYFLYHFPDFKINPEKCPNTCRDMRVVQCDAFGSIIKKDRKQLDQRADHLDNVRYFVNTFAKKQWIVPHQKMFKGTPPPPVKPKIDLSKVDIRSPFIGQ